MCAAAQLLTAEAWGLPMQCQEICCICDSHRVHTALGQQSSAWELSTTSIRPASLHSHWPAAVLHWLQPGPALPARSAKTLSSLQLHPAAALGSKPLPYTHQSGRTLEGASLTNSLLRWIMPLGSVCLNMAIQEGFFF